jgi:hypothetical protein
MSMRRWLGITVLRIAVLAAAALPSAAAAQSAFDQRIAHWRISAGGASCIAFNRPAYELNASPFNALSVQLNKQGVGTSWSTSGRKPSRRMPTYRSSSALAERRT